MLVMKLICRFSVLMLLVFLLLFMQIFEIDASGAFASPFRPEYLKFLQSPVSPFQSYFDCPRYSHPFLKLLYTVILLIVVVLLLKLLLLSQLCSPKTFRWSKYTERQKIHTTYYLCIFSKGMTQKRKQSIYYATLFIGASIQGKNI